MTTAQPATPTARQGRARRAAAARTTRHRSGGSSAGVSRAIAWHQPAAVAGLCAWVELVCSSAAPRETLGFFKSCGVLFRCEVVEHFFLIEDEAKAIGVVHQRVADFAGVHVVPLGLDQSANVQEAVPFGLPEQAAKTMPVSVSMISNSMAPSPSYPSRYASAIACKSPTVAAPASVKLFAMPSVTRAYEVSVALLVKVMLFMVLLWLVGGNRAAHVHKCITDNSAAQALFCNTQKGGI